MDYNITFRTTDDFDDDAGYFAPVATDKISTLIARYRQKEMEIDTVSAFMTETTNAGTLGYFLEGNFRGDARGSARTASRGMFDKAGAINALNSHYWGLAMKETDIYDTMPQERRDKWDDSIREQTTPNFDEETVRATFTELLSMRLTFLSERVDGIFRALSGDHLTNSPQGFGKRMIIAGLIDSYGSYGYRTCGFINDLRCIIAKFMERDEPRHYLTSQLVTRLINTKSFGEWFSLDGGALRLKIFKKGTAHLEIHPDIAWRLNKILAHLYPAAIPAEFRQKPVRVAKTVPLMSKPLSFAVIEALDSLEPGYDLVEQPDNWRQPTKHVRLVNSVQFKYSSADKHAIAEAMKVLKSIGGVVRKDRVIVFDYNPSIIIAQIVASGIIPDEKSHQFYATPERLAKRVIELAEIGDTDTCLEPSAGIGDLAVLLPADRTTAIEVADLRANVLKERGLTNVICGDFLKWSTPERFDRVVMNPPFDLGRWKAHVETAARLVATGGRLVAILPSGASSFKLPGFKQTWSDPIAGEFADTSVSVVILVADRE